MSFVNMRGNKFAIKPITLTWMQDGAFQKSQRNKQSGFGSFVDRNTVKKKLTKWKSAIHCSSFGWICNGIFWGFLYTVCQGRTRWPLMSRNHLRSQASVPSATTRSQQVNAFFRSIDLLTAFVRFCYLHVGCMVWHSSKKPSSRAWLIRFHCILVTTHHPGNELV